MAKNLPLGRSQLKALILLSNLTIDNNLFQTFFSFLAQNVAVQPDLDGSGKDNKQTSRVRILFGGNFVFLDNKQRSCSE